MKQLNEHHSFTGMQRDLDPLKHPVTLLYNARNIRLTPREGDTLLSITNERGPKAVQKKGSSDTIEINGTYLGHCLLNNYLVVFSKGDKDYITRINLEDNSVSLFSGNLNFQLNSYIKAIGSYESDKVQKVYWTDNVNQPRVINIAVDDISLLREDSFDFVRELSLQEKVTIKKQNSGGEFAPGVIQYAFTYFDKYQQESGIFYTSPLLYISQADRGGSPEEKSTNCFKITIEGLDNTKFNYLRVYSIQRTSLNGTPIVKRIQDTPINNTQKVSITDTGMIGDAIDPTELLFKGGEVIKAKTIEQKDNTLFLGNITLNRTPVSEIFSKYNINPSDIEIEDSTRAIYCDTVKTGSYSWGNQLNAHSESGNLNWGTSTSCAGFKTGETYRFGVQFQYKNGQWSEPIHIDDLPINNKFSFASGGSEEIIILPTMKGTIPFEVADNLYSEGYRRVRALVVFPAINERDVLCQGVVCPTINTEEQLYQPSWFFREYKTASINVPGCTSSLSSLDDKYYVPTFQFWTYAKDIEIQGNFSSSRFLVSPDVVTFHSPDIEFEDAFENIHFPGKFKKVGSVQFMSVLSDINIQTETPTANSMGAGFTSSKYNNIIAGGFYEDVVLDKNNDDVEMYEGEQTPVRWLVYPWHRDGSLNNDTDRAVGKGVKTSILKKKVISNLRYAESTLTEDNSEYYFLNTPQLYKGEQLHILKFGNNNNIYQGNIDTLLLPDNSSNFYFLLDGEGNTVAEKLTNSDNHFKSTSVTSTNIYKIISQIDVGEGLRLKTLQSSKDKIRMKYKSSPHLLCQLPTNSDLIKGKDLAIIDIINPNVESKFGELKANMWVPCGEPVYLNTAQGEDTDFYYEYGDTYYQRWDCLKTYPFTNEDANQIVEIGSFMLESRINIDGRYDKNRGQENNLNITMQNFNLLNPVYSQINNFFTYRILDEDYYKNNRFPNQITWSKEKQMNADVDAWTNVTLASTYNLDGSKGEITALISHADKLYCIQNKGISIILFNSRVQIPTSDGVPIEITNGYKVDGCRYISEGIGCDDEPLVSKTPSGIYFIDSAKNYLYHIADTISDITTTHNMSSWFKDRNNIIKKVLYDTVNHDLYLVKDTEALCFSEILGQFVSLYDYGGMSLLECYNRSVYALHAHSPALLKMFEGDYNLLFDGLASSWEITFISNGMDNNVQDFTKIFSNIDYRMDVFTQNGEYLKDITFDTLSVSNEYQDTGEVNLNTGYTILKPFETNLQKKFRTWRIQIPRNKNSLDRINNQWCKITLKFNPYNHSTNNYKAVLHDLNVQYYV